MTGSVFFSCVFVETFQASSFSLVIVGSDQPNLILGVCRLYGLTPPRLYGATSIYVGGDYRHLDKLVSALSHMPALTSFYTDCPFYTPSSILNALIRCPSIREISVANAPLYVSMIPNIPADFKLETILIVLVTEPLHVGEGPYEPKYHEVTYYIREYRKKYKNDILVRFATTAILFRAGKASPLRCTGFWGLVHTGRAG